MRLMLRIWSYDYLGVRFAGATGAESVRPGRTQTERIRQMKKIYTSPYEYEGLIPLKQAIPLGLQHVLAMFVGNLSPLLVLLSVCQITIEGGMGDLRISLLQNAMLVAGIVTLIQLFPIGPIGGKLPIVMGTSASFIGIGKSIAVSLMAGISAGTITSNVEAGIYAYGAIMGASLIGGAFEMGLGFLIRPLRKFFPPVVTGSVVLCIGLGLIPVGIGFFGGGSDRADFGSGWNLLLGFITLAAILVFKFCFKGFVSVSSILFGIIVGYIASFVMGLCLPETVIVNGVETTAGYITDWSQVAEASWFAVPEIFPIPLQFNLNAIIPMCILFLVTTVETIGDVTGVTQGGFDREPTDKEISGGVVCDGFGSALATLFGVLPNTSFSQNVGLVGMTKIVNRVAISVGAIILIISGLFPKIGAVISIMPQPVLGGAAVMMFASIVISGINVLTAKPLTVRDATIVMVALGLGYGLGSTPGVQAYMPEWLRCALGESGLVPAALIAILLNIILPKGKDKNVTPPAQK